MSQRTGRRNRVAPRGGAKAEHDQERRMKPGSAITFILQLPMNVESIVRLGYPVYIPPFIGVAKVLGILAIVTGRFPKLKAWAYAGFTFDLLGASYSQLAPGKLSKAPVPLGMLILMLISYALWKLRQGERPWALQAGIECMRAGGSAAEPPLRGRARW
jgi:DoxX-like family